MDPRNFPGGTDKIDTIAHRCATTAVNSFLIGVTLAGALPEDTESSIREWLEDALQQHPQKADLIPRSMYFAKLMLSGRSRTPIGYGDA